MKKKTAKYVSCQNYSYIRMYTYVTLDPNTKKSVQTCLVKAQVGFNPQVTNMSQNPHPNGRPKPWHHPRAQFQEIYLGSMQQPSPLLKYYSIIAACQAEIELMSVVHRTHCYKGILLCKSGCGTKIHCA